MSRMSVTEDIIAADIPKGTALLNDLSTCANKVNNICTDLCERIQSDSFTTEKGISLLELKNQLFLGYLSNLAFTSLLKLSGIKINGNFSIDNLVELRVILERIRPLEDKFKNQIQKQIKIGSSGQSSSQLNAKNSLDNIADSSDEELEEDEKEDKDQKDDNQLYRIPKITQKYYPGEEKEDTKRKRERARALSSAMFRDAMEEHTEDPEVFHNNDTLKQKAIERRKQIQRYEEENFTRLILSKKERASLKQMSTHSSLGKDLLSFRSLHALEGESPSTSAANKKRKKFTGKNKKQKGFKRKKKR